MCRLLLSQEEEERQEKQQRARSRKRQQEEADEQQELPDDEEEAVATDEDEAADEGSEGSDDADLADLVAEDEDELQEGGAGAGKQLGARAEVYDEGAGYEVRLWWGAGDGGVDRAGCGARGRGEGLGAMPRRVSSVGPPPPLARLSPSSSFLDEMGGPGRE